MKKTGRGSARRPLASPDCPSFASGPNVVGRVPIALPISRIPGSVATSLLLGQGVSQPPFGRSAPPVSCRLVNLVASPIGLDVHATQTPGRRHAIPAVARTRPSGLMVGQGRSRPLRTIRTSSCDCLMEGFIPRRKMEESIGRAFQNLNRTRECARPVPKGALVIRIGCSSRAITPVGAVRGGATRKVSGQDASMRGANRGCCSVRGQLGPRKIAASILSSGN